MHPVRAVLPSALAVTVQPSTNDEHAYGHAATETSSALDIQSRAERALSRPGPGDSPDARVSSREALNPVNRVRMAAELMSTTFDLPVEAERTAAMIIRAADEVNRLIGDLLDVARIEAGRLSIETAPILIGDLLERLEEAHSHAATEKGVSWDVQRFAQPLMVEVDEDRIRGRYALPA